MHGVKEKHIAEISPQQLGNLGKRAKKEYDDRNRQEWVTYSCSGADYAMAVADAFKKGLWNGRDGTDDAVTRLGEFLRAEEEEEYKKRRDDMLKANNDQSVVIEVGDVVWLVTGGYFKVSKIVRRRYHFENSPFNSPRSMLALRSYDDIAKLAKEGKPLTKKNHDTNK